MTEEQLEQLTQNLVNQYSNSMTEAVMRKSQLEMQWQKQLEDYKQMLEAAVLNGSPGATGVQGATGPVGATGAQGSTGPTHQWTTYKVGSEPNYLDILREDIELKEERPKENAKILDKLLNLK